MKYLLTFLIIFLLVQSNFSQVIYNNPITFTQYLESYSEDYKFQMSGIKSEQSDDLYKAEKIIQFSFGVLSASTIAAGLVFLVVGEINEDKYFKLAEQMAEEYDKAISTSDLKKFKEKYDLYRDKVEKSQKLSKGGIFMQLGGGICLGISILWGLDINRSKHKSKSKQ